MFVPLPALRRAASSLALSLLLPASAWALDVQAGIGFLAVTDVLEGTEIALEDPAGGVLETGEADRFGSLLFRELEQGRTYALRELDSEDPPTNVRVLRFDEHPDRSFYESQTLGSGYQYIEMRDGTRLSVMVRPPLGRSLAQGPFPTVVEYSGYDPANPTAFEPVTLLSSALGFATVGVNMRGSGCSGGVFDLFDLPTTADGYDIIETVAAQDWVAGNVGMVGISFSGISQLFVGGARPPHLAAISPLSVIGDIYRHPGFPGGIRNSGFAESWLRERQRDARPAPEGGQGWARDRARDGDEVCLENQKLRLQTLDPIEFTTTRPYYEAELMDPRSPIEWIGQTEVPIFLSGAWQDEQTGPGFATLLAEMPPGRANKVVVVNGVHSSTLEPEILYEWIAFLDLYVAGNLPDPGRSAPFASVIAAEILGAGSPTPPLPVDRYDGAPHMAAARHLFTTTPRFRVLMENGAGSATPGLPAPTFELGFDRWPPRRARPRAWYLGDAGRLSARRMKKGEDGVAAYRPDPDARPQQTLPGNGQSDSWRVMPPYDWRPLLGDTAVAWVTEPLEEDVITVGAGSVDLWLRSDAEDTDLQVTLSEVRSDGREAYVQSGWLRGSHRTLDRRASSRLEPVHTHLEADATPMPFGEFTSVRVPIMSAAHVFRAGSRIRISVEAPGGDRTRWAFDTPATGGGVLNEIAFSRGMASRLVLPVVGGITPPAGPVPCPGLRGQPCRDYVPASNGG